MSTGMVPFVRFFPQQGTAETCLLKNSALKLVAQVLADPTYAARLESHYYQVKRAASGPSHPTRQMPARHAKANKHRPQRQPGKRKKRT